MKNDEKILKIVNKRNLNANELERILKSVENAAPQQVQAFTDYFERKVKFGVFSDCHIGAKEFDEPFFKHMVKTFKREKVSRIYQCGDILEGMSGRPGHIYELSEIGFAQQFSKAKRLFKLFDCPVFGIDGNHDEWYQKQNNQGVIIGAELQNQVEKYTNLGQMEANIRLGRNVTMKLFHPNDGTAYAICFDDKTEILTKKGWKSFSKVCNKDLFATLNKKGFLEWQKANDFIENDFEGNLLHFNARSFDLLVTPNHRMFVRRYPNNLLQSRKKFLIFPTKSHRRVEFNW